MGDAKLQVNTLPPPPDLAFHVDVTSTDNEGRWLGVAMLADEPDIGTGDDPRGALREALAALGEPWASEMAASAGVPELNARPLVPRCPTRDGHGDDAG